MADTSSHFEHASGNLTTTPDANAGGLYLSKTPFVSTLIQVQTNSTPAHGIRAIRMNLTNTSYVDDTSARYDVTGNYYSYRGYYRVSALPSSGKAIPLILGVPYGYNGLWLLSDGTIKWGETSGANLTLQGSATSAVTVDKWFRIECSNTSGSGDVRARLFLTPDAAVGSYTSQIDGTGLYLYDKVSPLTAACYNTSGSGKDTSGFSGYVWLDDFAVKDMGATTTETWIGPATPTAMVRRGWGVRYRAN